jgi:hypothetical protein
MVSANVAEGSGTEELLAVLTAAAYRVALRHGIKGPFIDLELDLWHELRGVLNDYEEIDTWPR